MNPLLRKYKLLYDVISWTAESANFPAKSTKQKNKCVCVFLTIFLFFVCVCVCRGDCATCQVNIAGRNVKACVGTVPPEPRLKSLQEKGLEVRG